MSGRLTRRQLLRAGAAGLAAPWLPGCGPGDGGVPLEGPTFDAGGELPWRNWSGLQSCLPIGRAAPTTEDEIARILRTRRGILRPCGAGHSFSALVPTDGTLIALDELTGVISADAATRQAEVWAGTRLSALGPALAAHGQASPNLPDIAYQALGGAIATSTHGTGVGFGSLSDQVVGLALVTPQGRIVECDARRNPEIFAAARCSLGALGVVSRVRLQNQASFRLRERVEIAELEDVLADLERYKRDFRHFELMPFPNSSLTILITDEETDEPADAFPPEDPGAVDLLENAFRFVRGLPLVGETIYDGAIETLAEPSERIGPSWAVLTHHRIHRFNEMEYTVPAALGPDCLREVLRTIREREIPIAFPLEYRYVKADDVWLSMFHQRDGCSISIHQDARRDHRPYFDAVEPVFWKYQGRPHWGKLHSLDARRLAALYPRWRDFARVRATLDPQGRLLNEHLHGVLGV